MLLFQLKPIAAIAQPSFWGLTEIYTLSQVSTWELFNLSLKDQLRALQIYFQNHLPHPSMLFFPCLKHIPINTQIVL